MKKISRIQWGTNLSSSPIEKFSYLPSLDYRKHLPSDSLTNPSPLTASPPKSIGVDKPVSGSTLYKTPSWELATISVRPSSEACICSPASQEETEANGGHLHLPDNASYYAFDGAYEGLRYDHLLKRDKIFRLPWGERETLSTFHNTATYLRGGYLASNTFRSISDRY